MRHHVLALALLAISCSGGNTADPTDVPPGDIPHQDSPAPDARDVAPLPPPVPGDEVLAPGPYGVGELLLELEDPTRATPPNGSYEGADTRVLPTLVWYPAAPPPDGEDPLAPMPDVAPALDGGPWPLIVYSHGFSSRKDENDDLAAYLASRGFVVAAPDFPLSNIFAPGTASVVDMVNQPGDVRFVLDHLLGAHPDAAHPLLGRIDEGRIGVTGVSLGAMTSLAVTFHPDFRDPRVGAVVAAAPPGCYLAVEMFDGAEVPVLVVHGTGDRILSYPEHGPPTYANANPPKYFLTLEGGTHTAMAGLAMPLLRVMGNSDDVGCQTMEGNPSLDPDALAEMSSEAGGVDFATAQGCPAPCTVPITMTMMDAARQLELVQRATVAFFVARFMGDDRYEAYLREALTEGADDASLVFTP